MNSMSTKYTALDKPGYVSPMRDMLSKYTKLSKPAPPNLPTSTASSIWKAFVSDMAKSIYPQYIKKSTPEIDFEIYMYRNVTSLARPSYAPEGSPIITPSDKYMSESITKQYKQVACSTGIYSTSCTEGTTKLMADTSRILAVGKQFRNSQKSTASKYRDLFNNRKQAIVQSHGCSYEENLYCKLPKAASAAVKSYAESVGACNRSTTSVSKAENYMAYCVDLQSKTMNATTTGVYGVTCSDGNVNYLAEDKRTIGLAAKFRGSQLPTQMRLKKEYQQKKYARDFYSHECSYEEDLFNKYPAVSAAMTGLAGNY